MVAMSQNLTRWIEDADARKFHEAALFDRSLDISERQYLHLGGAIANLSSWLRHRINRGFLTSIGCQISTDHQQPHDGE
jgi:hypothetical protein